MASKGGPMARARDGNLALWIAFAALILLPLIFYAAMVFGGKEPAAPDTMAVRPLGVWARAAARDLGQTPLWIPHLLSGMPSYGSYVYTPASPLSPLDWFLRPFADARGVRYYLFLLLGGFSAFAFLRRHGFSPPASAAAALCFVMTPYLPGCVEAGHATKIRALMHVPLVFLTLDLLLDRAGPLTAAALALALAMLGWSNHPQILFYAGFISTLYVLGCVLADRAAWSQRRIGLTAGWAVVSGAVAFLLIAEPTLAVKEYAPFSIRGAGEGGGTGWEYATAWSFSPKELISLLFPGFFGFRGATYFGYAPFTQSTHYIGIITLVAAAFGFLRRRSSHGWIWLAVSLVLLLIGFGSHMPILFGPLYKLVPYFNKFRVPSMIYSLLPLTLGFLVASGLDALSAPAETPRKGRSGGVGRNWLLAGATALLIAIIVFALTKAGAPPDSGLIRPQEAGRLSSDQMEGLRAARWAARNGSIALGFLLLGIFLTAVPFARRLRRPAGTALLGLILVADVWVVGAKFVDFVPKSQVDTVQQSTPQIEYLRRQPGPFRVLPLEDFGSNKFVAFNISTVGGYQPAKLRVYQDLLDQQLLMNPAVLSMLNVRYLLSDQNPGAAVFKPVSDGVYEFTAAQSRAWFVPAWREAADETAVLRGLGGRDFDPAAIAYFSRGRTPQLATSGLPVRDVQVESESPHVLKLRVADGDGPGLLIVSEIYYPAGWTATIDGAATPILQANHCLRAVVVPGGAHTIEMKFASKGYRTGRMLNRAGGFVLLALAAFGIFLRRQERARSR
jgi:hypothetical protein